MEAEKGTRRWRRRILLTSRQSCHEQLYKLCIILKGAIYTVNKIYLCIYQDNFPADGSQVSRGSGTFLYLAQTYYTG